MKTAYFDCSSGIAGNMILGALIDAGLDLSYLKKELRKLQITNHKSQTNYKLQIQKVKRNGIASTYVQVTAKDRQPHRSLANIEAIIKKSKLNRKAKKLSLRIFQRLAEAEAKVHGVPVSRIHFHEVGAVDAIIDIVGTAIGLEELGIEKVYCSPVPFGQGTIKHAHGILPIPAPATAYLLKGIPTYQVNVKGELTTPTGAAIITTMAEFSDLPRMRLENVGSGSGSLTFPNLSNLLRIFIGEAEIPAEKDSVLEIEANIDDMDPRSYPKVIAKLMQAGALDACVVPILMKKKRPGFNLIVLCSPEKRDKILDAVFTHTTTFGVRTFVSSREKLKRKFKTIKTKYGKVRVKLGLLGKQIKTIAPEFKDYKKLAAKHRIPMEKVYKEAWKKILPGK